MVWEHTADTDMKTALGKDHTFNALGRRRARFSQKAENRPQKDSWCLSHPSRDPKGPMSNSGTTGTWD